MARYTQILLWLLPSVAVMGLLLVLLAPVLTPFILALALAYFLDPLVDRLEAWGCSRLLGTSVIGAGLVCALTLLILFGLPFLLRNIFGFLATLPRKLELLHSWLRQYVDIDMQDGLLSSLVDWAQATVSAREIFAQGAGAFNVVAMIIITPVVTFYLLKDWDRLVAAIDYIVRRYCSAEQTDLLHRLLADIDSSLASFARGQLLVCVLLGLFYSLGLFWIGLDGAIAVGMLAGILSFIPYAGAVLGGILTFGLLLAQYGFATDILLWGCAVFVFGQFLEGNLLTPWLVGNKIRLHPVWIIFALLAFGQLLGFLGLLLALPLAAAIGTVVRFILREWPGAPPKT